MVLDLPHAPSSLHLFPFPSLSLIDNSGFSLTCNAKSAFVFYAIIRDPQRFTHVGTESARRVVSTLVFRRWHEGFREDFDKNV